MFKVYHASLQTFFDTPNCVLEGHVYYSMVHILNVFCDGHLQLISCVGIVLYHNRQVHRDFLITLYMCSGHLNFGSPFSWLVLINSSQLLQAICKIQSP